jgi:glycine cleavage system T protein (aminomethyltransferase)
MAQVAVTHDLKRTPLYDIHAALGAKLVPFAGFEMPVQYPTGITAEHRAVRERAGLFDVSHMGEFIVRGPGAGEFVNYVTTNDVATLAPGQAHYSTILNDRGTIEDDCLVYRFADHVMVVVNASNVDKDFAHISKHTSVDLASVKYYHFAVGTVAGVPEVIVSRTGYTGEDGFELYFPAAVAPTIWTALTASGEVTPAGLGARDSLRLEMGMALYGSDIDDTVTPLEANLGWLVKLKKGDFVGREMLVRQKEQGLTKRLVGFTSGERAFPRHGYPVFYEGEASGIVHSGTLSPSLNIPIGTCYLPIEGAKRGEGTPLEIEIRGKRVPATVARLPFYKKGSHL